MPAIAKTRLGTSDIPGDICSGFALFPDVGTVRAGMSLASKTDSLIQKHPTLVNFRLQLNAGVQLLAGICGPAYGVRYDVEGEAADDRITLRISDDSIGAGFFDAYQVTFSVTCRLETWWFGWHEVFNLKPSVKIDVLNLLYSIIQKLLSEKKSKTEEPKTKVEDNATVTAEDKNDKGKKKTVKGLSIYDFAQGSLAKQGAFSAQPSLDFPIDLVSMIPALKGLKAALEALWGSLFFGPIIGLLIPVKVEVKSVTLDGETFGTVTIADGTLTATGGQVPAAPQRLGMTLAHRPGFDVGLSIGAEISVCKLFKLSGSTPRIALAKLLGISIAAGPFNNDVSNGIGRSTIAGRAQEPRFAEAFEVVLEPAKTVG